MFKKSSLTSLRAILLISVLLVLFTILLISMLFSSTGNQTQKLVTANTKLTVKDAHAGDALKVSQAVTWKAPNENSIPAGKAGETIRYGKELLAHTSKYFGPNGSLAQITNGLDCQNCHLDAGTRLFGNNYAGFISAYPKMSYRSGKVEPASQRIAECFERSLAGKVPDTSGREVQAILAYMKWIGKDVKKGQKLFGSSTQKLPFLNASADLFAGKGVYVAKCQSCHGHTGEGLLAADKRSYTYPPLWGSHSYNDGAGMYRIINFAGFVKNNMPYGATYKQPQLTDKEAWDIAAFVNSQPRPHRKPGSDWPDLKKKPIDVPFGPYADRFSEKQHKYGPYKPITDVQKSQIIKS